MGGRYAQGVRPIKPLYQSAAEYVVRLVNAGPNHSRGKPGNGDQLTCGMVTDRSPKHVACVPTYGLRWYTAAPSMWTHGASWNHSHNAPVVLESGAKRSGVVVGTSIRSPG